MVLQAGDEFVVLAWDDLTATYSAARVLVGPPGAEPLRLGVGGRSAVRPFPESQLWVLPPDGAQAILDRARAGGTAADDAP